MRQTILAAAAVTLGALVLGACNDGSAPEPAATDARNAEDIAGLRIENARLILPAVAGNPGVVYFDIVNTSPQDHAVLRADVEGAGRSEVHSSMTTAYGEMSMAPAGPQTVAAGQTFAFAPGGYHVMVFDLAPELAAGGQTEVTLTFEGGDKTSFMVPIRSAGDER